MSAMLSPPGMSRPTSPAVPSPGVMAKPAASFRVVKKAVLKESKDLESAKCGSIKPGIVVDVVEVDGNRVRTQHGWLSIIASSGTKLLERVEPSNATPGLAAAPAPAPAVPAPGAAAPAPAAPVAVQTALWRWELKKWERSGLHGEQTTKPFEADSSAKLELAYRTYCTGGAGVIKLVLSGSEYKIDLRRMLQVNATTGFERQLSRDGPELPRTATAPAAASAGQVPRSPQLAAALAQRNVEAHAAGMSPAARSPAAAVKNGTSPTPAGGQPGPAVAAPLPRITMYFNKGRSSTVWMCRLLNRGSQLGFFVETTFGRAFPMAKCLGTDTTKAKAKPEGSRAPSEDEGKKTMRELAMAKMQRGYTKAPPPDVCPSKLPKFFEIGSEHKCGACGSQMQAPERCEQLQCPAPGCEVYLSAAEVAKKAALEEERRVARAKERLEATAKSRKFGTGFAQKRDGGEQDLKAIKWFGWGLQHGDVNDVVLKQGLHAAQARVKIVKAMEKMASTVEQDCKDVGLVREVLSDATPLIKAAMAGPVQHLPFSWLSGADAAEKRAAANDRMKKGLKILTRHAKNLQATLKREAAAKAAAEAKAARAAAAARLGISRCYKCNWPGRPGDTCPNCSEGSDVVSLPAAPASEAGGKGVRRSSFGSASAGEMVCEYAKSGRAKCHGTGELIPKDELRIGVMEFSDTAGRVVPRWFHVDSFFECADVEGRLTNIDQIEGADRLRQHDQDLLADEIAKLAASGGTGKKRKAKVLSDDEDTDEDPIEVDEDWNGNDDDPIEDGHAWGPGSRLGGIDLTAETPWPLKVGEIVQLKPGATDYEGGPLVPGNTGVIADVSDDAEDEEPYQVAGKNGQTWWYESRQIEKA